MDTIDPMIIIPSKIIGTDRVQWAVDNISNFCVLPWLNLNTTPTGDIKLCCSIQRESYVENSKRLPYNLGRDSIENIWNSNYMTFAREQHRTGNGLSACEECYEMEDKNGHSPRIGQNAEWLNRQQNNPITQDAMGASTHNLVGNLKKFPISLELRLGNKCNLKCISCWGMSSSLIHEERKQIIATASDTDNKITSDFMRRWTNEVNDVEKSDLKNWYETSTFYNNIELMAPNLQRLYTTGGEPTLIKSNYKMLQILLDAKNTQCSVEFTSNMKTWNHEFYSRLEKFKTVEIQMSLDGMGEVGEYIRYPSNMTEVMANVERAVELASTRPGWKIKVYTVLQAFNYKHLLDIWEFLRDISDKYKKIIDWWPITLYMPNHLNLGAVDKNQRETYAKELTQQANDFNNNLSLFKINEHTLQSTIGSIVNFEYDGSLNEKLVAYTRIIDQSRGLDGISLFHKELFND